MMMISIKVSIFRGMTMSPGLVVMGGDSRPRVRVFESLHRIPNGIFFTFLVIKIVMFV